MKDLFQLSSYYFELPEELIAQHPAAPRDSSRLMVVDRKSGNISERRFSQIGEFLSDGDSLIFNETKVIPARLSGHRESGGKTEIFLVKPLDMGAWEVMARPGKKLKPGMKVLFSETFSCRLKEKKSCGTWTAEFFCEGSFDEQLQIHGEMPLPPYIKREKRDKRDLEDYQTVFAQNPGAVAAPTAGLHFTPELLEQLAKQGVAQHKITLHVGMGTFAPVQTENICDHRMHSERYFIPPETASALNRRSGGRQVAVGTTCCRTLESAFSEGKIREGNYQTDIFIYPGYRFKYVDALLTNFHLPKSTLLMLVSAFAGYDLMMEAYRKAVKEKYRFFSYGDAMLIL